MAGVANNLLQAVQTYNISGLGALLNRSPFLAISNFKFREFEQIGTNLGSSVTFDKLPRFVTSGGSLVWNPQATNQRVQTLTVDQAFTLSYNYTAEQIIFNVNKYGFNYMPRIVEGALATLANTVNTTFATVANSSTINQSTGNPNYLSGPVRAFGNGVTQINSYQQLARLSADAYDFGWPEGLNHMVIPVVSQPSIVSQALGQFAIERNDEIANTWYVADWQGVRIWTCNTLPTQTSGNVGANATTLTVLSTNDATGQNITQITFSGAGTSDASAIAYGDIFTFNDGVSGKPNLRFLTWLGATQSTQQVQFRASAAAGSDGSGHVVVNIYPGLTVGPSVTDNFSINTNIIAGMQASVLPSHVCGYYVADGWQFVATPRLPEMRPFDSSVDTDPLTGLSMRTGYGTYLGQDNYLFGHDVIAGITTPPEGCVRIAFPLNIT